MKVVPEAQTPVGRDGAVRSPSSRQAPPASSAPCWTPSHLDTGFPGPVPQPSWGPTAGSVEKTEQGKEACEYPAHWPGGLGPKPGRGLGLPTRRKTPPRRCVLSGSLSLPSSENRAWTWRKVRRDGAGGPAPGNAGQALLRPLCSSSRTSALRCASDLRLDGRWPPPAALGRAGVRPVRMRGFRCCRGEASGASGVRVRLVGASCPGAASGRGSRDTGSSRDGARPGLPLLGARPRAIPRWRLHDKDTEVPRRQATSWPEPLNLPPQRFWWLSFWVKGTKGPCVARWVVAAWVEQSPWLCSLAIPGASGPEHPLAHLATSSDRSLSPRLCLSFCVRLSTFPFSCCPWAEFQSPFFSFLTD